MKSFCRNASAHLLAALLLVCIAPLRASAATPAASDAVNPPGYTLAYTGGPHDFDYFQGAWTTQQRRLVKRGTGSKGPWETFPATLCMTEYLDGRATVDELYFPTKGWAGLTLRLFDPARKQWSIYWVSSADGKLGPPVFGGFHGNQGEFFGEDHDQGRPVKVRFLWTKLDHDHARWEQAFSYDNRTWETNWTADFVRANLAATCTRGRPKR
jgi:hypothetical protein